MRQWLVVVDPCRASVGRDAPVQIPVKALIHSEKRKLTSCT